MNHSTTSKTRYWAWTLSCLIFISSFSLWGQDTSTTYLYFRPGETTLNYLTTYHAETTDILNILKENGEDQSMKNTTFETIEAKKDLTRSAKGSEVNEDISDSTLQATTLETKIKMYFIKKVDRNQAAKSIQPEEKILIHSSIGRLIDPFNMDDLPYFGMPLFFAVEPVDEKKQNTWNKKFDITGANIPVISADATYTLKRVFDLNMRKVAEIEYSFQATLSTTQITSDPELKSKIELLARNNIEMVSFDGNGKVAFDMDRGLVLTHVLNINRRLRKVSLHGQERMIQNLLTIVDFSEALTN